MTDNSIQRIVSVQVITSLVIAALSLMADILAAWSALLGGMSVAMPSLYMAVRLHFGSVSAGSALPQVALAQMLGAELGKLLLTGLMIGAVFIWVKPLSVGFFFFGLLATYGCGLAAALAQSIRTSKAGVTSGH